MSAQRKKYNGKHHSRMKKNAKSEVFTFDDLRYDMSQFDSTLQKFDPTPYSPRWISGYKIQTKSNKGRKHISPKTYLEDMHTKELQTAKHRRKLTKSRTLSHVHIDHMEHIKSKRPKSVSYKIPTWVDDRPKPYKFSKRPSAESIQNLDNNGTYKLENYKMESPMLNVHPNRECNFIHSGKRKLKPKYKDEKYYTKTFMPEKQAPTFNNAKVKAPIDSKKIFTDSFKTTIDMMINPTLCKKKKNRCDIYKDHPSTKTRLSLNDIYKNSTPMNAETKLFHSQSCTKIFDFNNHNNHDTTNYNYSYYKSNSNSNSNSKSIMKHHHHQRAQTPQLSHSSSMMTLSNKGTSHEFTNNYNNNENSPNQMNRYNSHKTLYQIAQLKRPQTSLTYTFESPKVQPNKRYINNTIPLQSRTHTSLMSTLLQSPG